MILSDYELALLYSANGDDSKVEKLFAESMQKLRSMNLVLVGSDPEGTGYVITESGKRFLAENMNNRGVA